MPEIRENSPVVTQITTVKLHPETQNEVLDLMTERARFMATQPGFVSVSLHRSSDRSHVLNYIQWTDRERLAAAHHAPEFRPMGLRITPARCPQAHSGSNNNNNNSSSSKQPIRIG
jgi:quinol monooxygenase YgiN